MVGLAAGFVDAERVIAAACTLYEGNRTTHAVTVAGGVAAALISAFTTVAGGWIGAGLTVGTKTGTVFIGANHAVCGATFLAAG